MASCAPCVMKNPAVGRPVTLLLSVTRAFLPMNLIMLIFCGTGVSYDARPTYGLMTAIQWRVQKLFRAITHIREKRDSVFLLDVPKKLRELRGSPQFLSQLEKKSDFLADS